MRGSAQGVSAELSHFATADHLLTCSYGIPLASVDDGGSRRSNAGRGTAGHRRAGGGRAAGDQRGRAEPQRHADGRYAPEMAEHPHGRRAEDSRPPRLVGPRSRGAKRCLGSRQLARRPTRLVLAPIPNNSEFCVRNPLDAGTCGEIGSHSHRGVPMTRMFLLAGVMLATVAGHAQEKPKLPTQQETLAKWPWSIELQAMPFQQQRVQITLAPKEGMEYKYRLAEGGSFLYSWTATSELYWELHSEPEGAPRGYAEFFDTNQGAGSNGAYQAPFTG